VVEAAPQPADVAAPQPVGDAATVSDPVVEAAPQPADVAAPQPTDVAAPQTAGDAAPQPVDVAAPQPVDVAAPQPADVAEPAAVVEDNAVVVDALVVNQPEDAEQVDELLESSPEATQAETSPGRIAVSVTPKAVLNFEAGQFTAQKVAYVIPIVSCKEGNVPDDAALYDAAAVLAHSIRKNSVSDPHSKSQYSYDLIAMFHPEVVTCEGNNRALLLKSLGYKIMVMDIPVPLTDIQGAFLRNSIVKVGGGGEKDWIKINVFSLHHYAIAVLLDIKTIILQPLDELFNLFSRQQDDLVPVFSGEVVPTAKTHKDIQPSVLNLLFARVYTTVEPQNFATGINTAFLVLRPSLDIFNEMKTVLATGSYNYANGWGSQADKSSYYRSAQTRGFLAYFFTDIQPHTSLEIDRCVYGNIADIPYIRVEGAKVCRDTQLPFGGDNCRDCRDAPIENIRSIEFGACGDPWSCGPVHLMTPTCKNFHALWHQLRMDLGDLVGRHPCAGTGYENYEKLSPPDLSQIALR